MANAHPGVFTVNNYEAFAINQDGSINSASNPAPTGTYVTIFGTGLGPIEPTQADGTFIELPLPTNALPVTLTSVQEGLPGFPVAPPPPITRQYAGPAPFQAAGVSQINFLATGFNFPIGLAVGTGSCLFYVSPIGRFA